MPQKVATPCLIFFRAGHARYAGSCTWETHRGRAVGRSMASSAHVAWLARKKMRHHRPEVATFRDPWGHADWALALRMRFPAPVIGSKHGACFASGAWGLGASVVLRAAYSALRSAFGCIRPVSRFEPAPSETKGVANFLGAAPLLRRYCRRQTR